MTAAKARAAKRRRSRWSIGAAVVLLTAAAILAVGTVQALAGSPGGGGTVCIDGVCTIGVTDPGDPGGPGSVRSRRWIDRAVKPERLHEHRPYEGV